MIRATTLGACLTIGAVAATLAHSPAIHAIETKPARSGAKAAAAGKANSATSDDAAITYRIMRSIRNDVTLSESAQSVKVETVNGAVTLKGAVRNIAEKSIVVAMAEAVAGSKNVKSELTVAE